MGQAKNTVLFGMVTDVEASYGGGGTVDDAADAVQMVEETLGTIQYEHDGDRGPDPSTGRPLKRAAPSARWLEWAPPIRVRGPGSAYSATVFPELMRILRYCGWSSTLDATPSSESYTFALAAMTATMEGGFGEVYGRGEKSVFTHAYGSMNYVIDAAGYMVATPNIMAVMGSTKAEEALPSLTIGTQIHPKAVAMSLALGDFASPKWRRIEFQQNRTLEPRLSGNETLGHCGFAYGASDPRFIVDLEATDFVNSPYHTVAGLDPWQMWDAGTEIPVSFTLGANQYNRCTHTLSNCQLAEPPGEPSEGPTGMWRLTFQVNDATSWVFD